MEFNPRSPHGERLHGNDSTDRLIGNFSPVRFPFYYYIIIRCKVV